MATPEGSQPQGSSEMFLKFSLAEEQHFFQDHAKGANASALGTVYDFPTMFGLKKGDWKAFDKKIRDMSTPGEVEYVLIYLARHGQGFHNIGEEYVGTDLWMRPSELSQTPIHEYFTDARLTPVGQHQANTLSATLKPMIESQSLPWPQKFFCSPLHRAIETSFRTWSPMATNIRDMSPQIGNVDDSKQRDQNANRVDDGNENASTRPYDPIIIEELREQLYLMNCNKRCTRSEIVDTFAFQNYIREASGLPPVSLSSTFTLPPNFSERDEIFERMLTRQPPQNQDQEEQKQKQKQKQPLIPPQSESEAEATLRAHKALHTILSITFSSSSSSATEPEAKSKDPIHYISITSHAGLMSSIYQIFSIKHTDVPRFPTGIMIPLLLRVERSSTPQVLPKVDPHVGSGCVGAVSPQDLLATYGLGPGGIDSVLKQIRDPKRYEEMIEFRFGGGEGDGDGDGNGGGDSKDGRRGEGANVSVNVKNKQGRKPKPKLTRKDLDEMKRDNVVDDLDWLILKAFL